MKLNKTSLNDLTLWYQSTDRFVGERIALGKYEEYETGLMMRQISKEDVVVDVGANIGYYTLLMAQRAKKVYAIEPEDDNFRILRKNIKENHIKNVILVRAAAGSKQGKVVLKKSKVNYGDHRLVKKNNYTASNKNNVVVECLKLDALLASESKIDLIKIDTQGWEPAVIEGAKKIINRDTPTLFLEYSPERYKEVNLQGGKMINFLKKRYPVIWNIDHWLYVYNKCGEIIKLNPQTGYANLWMKSQVRWQDYLIGYKNIRIKKIIKSIMATFGWR